MTTRTVQIPEYKYEKFFNEEEVVIFLNAQSEDGWHLFAAPHVSSATGFEGAPTYQHFVTLVRSRNIEVPEEQSEQPTAMNATGT